MRIGPICLKIRLAETRFENRVFGAAELALALEYTLKNESAFIIPLGDPVSTNTLDNGISQKISDRFAVVVALDNGSSDRDKVGLRAYDALHDARAEIFSAILGWQIPGTESLVSYGGGRIAGINRAWLWWQYEFVADTRISDDDGVEAVGEDGVSEETLPSFDSIYAQYILSPSVKSEAVKGATALPISIIDPDMESVIDFTSNPDVDGGFGKGFGIKFDVYKP